MQLFADVTSTTNDTTSLNFILKPTKNFTERLRKIKQNHMLYEGRSDFLKIVVVKNPIGLVRYNCSMKLGFEYEKYQNTDYFFPVFVSTKT